MGYKQVYGRTWDVYLCILTSSSPIGVREIWRALSLSSPSLAQYHVNKLLELRLIEATPDGKYMTNDEERLEALRSFLTLRGMLIPRMVVYAALLSGVLVSYVLFWPWRGDFRDLMTLSVTLFSIAAFLFEAVKQYRGLSVWKKEA
ncbi:MAG: helix-turn-helix transcriptional regulator [Candidatus Bathyarchaeota archaeon]|nr:MAG: helix-turn-helix transcriptional regulator [Candidatus Bathyarchaeota archaeon]